MSPSLISPSFGRSQLFTSHHENRTMTKPKWNIKYLRISAAAPLCSEDPEIQTAADIGRGHQRAGHLSKGRAWWCDWRKAGDVTSSLWFCWEDTGPPELDAHDRVPARSRAEGLRRQSWEWQRTAVGFSLISCSWSLRGCVGNVWPRWNTFSLTWW